MPTANVYMSDEIPQGSLITILPQFREFLARALSCGERTLAANEISIRVFSTVGAAMISPIEIEIIAHAYQQRAAQSDEICLSVQEFVKKQLPSAANVQVWLLLAELGHSWKE